MLEVLQQLSMTIIQERRQLTTTKLSHNTSRQDLVATVKRSLMEEQS